MISSARSSTVNVSARTTRSIIRLRRRLPMDWIARTMEVDRAKVPKIRSIESSMTNSFLLAIPCRGHSVLNCLPTELIMLASKRNVKI